MKKILCVLLVVWLGMPLFAAEASQLYRQCKGCHGKYGNHPPYERQNGIIAGRSQAELEAIMRAIREGEYKLGRVNKIMRKSIKDFSDEDIKILAEYISNFKREKTQ